MHQKVVTYLERSDVSGIKRVDGRRSDPGGSFGLPNSRQFKDLTVPGK